MTSLESALMCPPSQQFVSTRERQSTNRKQKPHIVAFDWQQNVHGMRIYKGKNDICHHQNQQFDVR